MLLVGAMLAIGAMTAASAAAVVSPNGDSELDNWKRVSVKGFDYTDNSWKLCGADVVKASTWCQIKGSGNWEWQFRSALAPPDTDICRLQKMLYHLTGDGRTMLADAEWTWFEFENPFRCKEMRPVSYAFRPAEQPYFSGEICKHTPSGQFYLNQGFLIAPRPGVQKSGEIWSPSFGLLTGGPYLSTGLQVMRLEYGTTEAFQAQGGSPTPALGWNQHMGHPFHNVLLTPNSTPCGWAGLT